MLANDILLLNQIKVCIKHHKIVHQYRSLIMFYMDVYVKIP